jgi:short-subunit dehydrogenase
MAKREIAGSRSIVTGASSGIGRELAVQLSQQGGHAVLVARSEDKLRELAETISADPQCTGSIEIVAGDVTDSAVRREAIERAQTVFGGLDAVINNAGVGAFGLFIESTPERLRQIMEVNFFAAAELIREALPALQNGRRPIIVNVGSILGHRGIPRMNEYCASKFAMQGLSQSLRIELRKLRIDLLVVSPGTVRTEFYDNVVAGKDGASWQHGYAVTGGDVARATIKAMRRGRREIFPNILGRLLVWANKSVPSLIDRGLRRYA